MALMREEKVENEHHRVLGGTPTKVSELAADDQLIVIVRSMRFESLLILFSYLVSQRLGRKKWGQ